MKKILLVLLLGGGFVIPFFIKGPSGEPIMSISDFIPSKPDINLNNLTSSGSDSGQMVYKYQDANGNWQYSDQPPTEASVPVEYETVEIDTNINTIDAVEVRERVETAAKESAPGVAGYVQDMQNVMEDAENVQALMDEREGKLEEAIKNSY